MYNQTKNFSHKEITVKQTLFEVLATTTMNPDILVTL